MIAGVGVFLFVKSGSGVSGNGINGSGNGNGVQEITLSYKNYNYYPNTITVKQGIPVKITLDSSIGGCYRTLVIPDLGVSKNSASPSDTVEFTPNKAGTFRFRCGMGMGTGTLIVE